MADGNIGTSGDAILGLVTNASNQLREMIKRSGEQLRNFVAQSIAQIDDKQRSAEARLEEATQAAEARAAAAANDALAAMRIEMAEAERRQKQAHEEALAKLRAEMAQQQAEFEGIRALGSAQLDIGDVGFDFSGDGIPDAAPEPSTALTVPAPVEVAIRDVPTQVVDLSDLREMIREIVEARLSTGDVESSGRITGGSTNLMWVNGKTLDKYEERLGNLEAITDAMLREFFADGTEFAIDEDGQQVEVSVSAFYRLGVETYAEARDALIAGAEAKRKKLASKGA